MTDDEFQDPRCECGTPPYQGKPWCSACRRILPLLDALEKCKSFDDSEMRVVSDEVKFLLEYISKRIRHSLSAMGYQENKT